MKAMRIEVDSFSFKNKLKEGRTYSLESTLQTASSVEKKENEKIGHLVLKVKVSGEKGKEEPFVLDAQISGYFVYDLDVSDKEIKEELEYDGVRLVYPNMRSLVSSLAGDAMIKPFQLPLIHLGNREQ